MKIGIIGVGTMGLPVARHILKSNNQLFFYARRKEIIELLKKEGGFFVDTIRSLGKNINIIILFVANYQQCRECLTELCTSFNNGVILIHSSLSPQQIIALENEFGTNERIIVSAPVSGGKKGAVEGKLITMVSGDKAGFALIEPIINLYSKDVFYLGSNIAKSQFVKLLNQVCVAINNIGVCTSVFIAEKGGLDIDLALRIIERCSGNSAIMTNRHNMIVNRDYTKQASISIITKDISNLINYCHNDDIELELLDNIYNIYKFCEKNGYQNEDIIALLKVLGRVSIKRESIIN